MTGTRHRGRPLKTGIEGAKKGMIEGKITEDNVFHRAEWKLGTQKADAKRWENGCW